jgi:hypothetical protein
MPQLLPEILRSTFTLIREEQGLRPLTDISCVCKAWRDIAQPVLWSHVVLNNDTLQNLVESDGNEPDKLNAVRSVTLHIQVIALTSHRSQYDVDTLESYNLHGSPGTRSLHRSIEKFTNWISPKLTSLLSFSLFVDAPPTDEAGYRINHNDDGFWLETAILGRLLKSLPTSCTSLELDTSGTDWSPRPESHHLCPDIWYILPRFRHVKLRIYTLCSQILLHDHKEPDCRRNEPDLRLLQPADTGTLVRADHLSTLSICMVSRMNAGRGSVTCPELQVRLDRGMNPMHITGGGGHQTKPPLLASNLVSVHQRGCFTAALKLEVVQRYQFLEPDLSDEDDLGDWAVMTQQEIQRRELYERAILLRDCVEDNTYPLPVRYIAEAMSGVYDKSDTCWVGAKDDVERHAENTVWGETIYGARMPFGAYGALFGAIQSPPKLLTRKEWRQRSKKGMLSWRREEGRPGVKINRVVALDGVDVEFVQTLMPLLPARGEPIPGDDRGVL